MLVKIFCSLIVVFCFIFNVLADNNKALKYLKLCLEKTSSKYLFDHLYDSWNNDSVSLEQELKKRNNPAAQRLLVRLYEREGRDNEALSACEKLLKKSPGKSILLLIKGRLEFNAHNYEQCVKDLNQALKDKNLSGKKAVEIKKTLGSAYLRMDKEKQALAVWKKLYADKHDLDFGEDVLQLMLTEGLYEEAKTFCEQLIKECKNKFRSLELSIKLAEIYRLKGSRKKALAAYRKILAKTGTGSWLEKEMFSRISQLYRAEDDSSGLIKFTAEFLKEFEARSAIRLRYIDMLFVSGAEDKALEAYRELIKKAPLNKGYRIAYAKMLIKAKKYKLAMDIYAGLVKRFPKNSELFFSKALLDVKTDKKQDTLADIKSYIALNSDNEYAYIRAAKVLESAKMNKEAGKFYKEFMKKFSSSVDALETYAVWLLRSGKTQEAVKLLCSGEELPLAILLRRSKLLLNYKQIPEVYALLLRFQKKYKNDFRFNEELFAVCVALKKQDDILKQIPVLLDTANSQDELSRAISSVCYVLKKDKIMEKYAQTLKTDENLKSNNICLLAVMQSRLEGDDRALLTLDGAIKKRPDELMFYRQKSALLNSAGEYAKAADVLKELLKHDSKARAMIYRQLINLYERADKKKEAVKWAAKLKREFPDSVMSWIIFARLQQQDGKPEEAIKILGRAIYRFPNNDELRQQLVSAYSSKGDMRGAINICWKILRQSNTPGSKLGMISKIYRLSNTDNLKNSLTSRLKLQMKNNPKDIFPLLALGEVAKLAYNYNDYRDYIQKASKVDKKSIYLLSKLAEIDEEQGSYTSAEDVLKKICEQDKSGKAKMKLADFYFRSGDDEKGLNIYQSYIRDNKDIDSLMSFAGDMIYRKHPEKAVEILKDKAVVSDNCIMHYLLGCAYEDVGKPKLAVKEFMQSIKLSGKLKSKSKITSLVRPNPWGIKYPPSLQLLTSIQMTYWRIYQQHNYNRYNRFMRGKLSIATPGTPSEAKAMVLCHLGKLNNKLSTEGQGELLEFLKASGVKYPDLALRAGQSNAYNASFDVKKLLKKYSNDIDAKFYLCSVYNRQFSQQIGKDKLNKILVELCQKRPEYSLTLIQYIFQNASKKDSKVIDVILKNLLKKDNVSLQNMHMFFWLLGNKRVKLSKEQKNMIKDLAVKNLKRMRHKKQIIASHTVYSMLNALLQNDFIKEAGEVLKIELKNSAKSRSSSPIYYNPYASRGQGLNFNKQTFPLGQLIKLPQVISMIMGRNYGANPKSRKNLYKACKGIKDIRIRLITADGTGDKKMAAKIAEEINADPKSGLSLLALCASWYNKDGKSEKACETLLKARRFLKSKKDRKELNVQLISYALSIKDKEKIKKYVADGSKKLLRLNLNLKEKVSLAKALRLAELNKKSEKLENMLLKSRKSNKFVISRNNLNPSQNAYKRVENKFSKKDTKAALNLAQREYRRMFRQIYNSFGGSNNYGYNSIYQLTNLCNLIKRFKAQDLMLKKLKPSSSDMPIKECEYALACQHLGKEKLAEETYKKVLKKNPKNRFASVQYVMLLLKGDYSSAAPILKQIPLEDLLLFANSIYNLFKKPEPMLNFYDLLIKKTAETKNLNSPQLMQKMHYFLSLLSHLENARHFGNSRLFGNERLNYKDVFACASTPEKIKKDLKKVIQRRQKLYLQLCDQMMRIPSWAETAFCRKLLLYRILKRDTKSFFDQGLKVMQVVNSAPINSYGYFNNTSHTLPDFDSYMVTTALKTKRLPELLKFAKDCRDSESVIKRIKNLEKLVICPKEQFLAQVEKLVKAEEDDKQRREFQKLVIGIYQFRKLDCDLTPMILKEFKLYNENVTNMYGGQNKFDALQAWITAVTERKKTKLLSSILKEIVDFYVKKYKKEFANEINVRSRFQQVFPWRMTQMLRQIMQSVMQKDENGWYFAYDAFKPIGEIKMFAQQTNFQHVFYQKINNDPVKFIKESPFLGNLTEIKFCPILQHGGIQTSLYNMTISQIRHNSKNKKKVKEYLKNIKKTTVGIKLFEAMMESNTDKVFAVLAEPQLKFEQQPLKWQQKFCRDLEQVFNNKRISSKFKSTSKGWKIYQLYQKLNSSNNQERIAKFYKLNIGYDIYGYSNKAGKLVSSIAKTDPEKAVKIFESAMRKIELYIIQNPNQRISNIQRNLFYNINGNCKDLKQCRAMYGYLPKFKNLSIDMINNFYSNLNRAINKKYQQAGGRKKAVEAAKATLKEYEEIFKNTKIVSTYHALSSLSRLSVKQLQEIIKYRASLKTKSNIRKQIDIILQAYLETRKEHTISPEMMDKMWAQIKVLPETWKVALGLRMLNLSGCEKISTVLIDPALKMILRGNNKIRNHNIKIIIEKLLMLNDDSLIKKFAQPLISYYTLEMCKWKDTELKNNRNLISYLISLAYRVDNKELVDKILKDFKMAKYPDVYIALANAGAEKIIKDFLDKNWKKFNTIPRLKLSAKGLKCVEKVCKSIKDPEEQYVVRSTFAVNSVYTKDKKGKISHRSQSKVLNKLAEEFKNIKFSDKKIKIYCLKLFFRNSQQVAILAKHASSKILSLTVNEIISMKDYNFSRRTGMFYFESASYGNSKVVSEKINEVIKLSKGSDRNIKNQAERLIRKCIDMYRSKFREIKVKELKGLITLSRVFIKSKPSNWNISLSYMALYSYLGGEQKGLIADMKKDKKIAESLANTNWRRPLSDLSVFCKKNKLDEKKEMLAFANSPLMKEIYKKKAAKLEKIKKDIIKRFEKKPQKAILIKVKGKKKNGASK